jgi:hypothetical protein
MLLSGFPPIERFCRLYITKGVGLGQPVNYESFTTMIFGAPGFSRAIRAPDRQKKADLVGVNCRGKCSRTERSHTRLFILPLAMVVGCTLTACSHRVSQTIGAEDRALTETAGFLSIMILAILSLFGPTVYRWWRQNK